MLVQSFEIRWQCDDEEKLTLDSCLQEKCRKAAKPMRCQKYFRTFFTLKKSSLDSKTCKNIVKNKRRRPHPNQKNLQKKTYRRKHIPKRRRTNNKQAGAWRRILTKKKRKRKGRRKSWLCQSVMSNKNKRTTGAA